MKKLLSLLVAWVVALELQGGNLIPGDSSFETGYGEWLKRGAVVEMADAPDGRQVLRLQGRTTTNVTFQLEPGRPYRFSLYMKAEGKPASVILQAYRTNWSGRNATAFPTVGTQWKRYELAIPPQKIGDHNKFWMVILAQNDATIYVDATQLEQAPSVTEYQPAEPVPFVCEVKAPVPGQVFLTGEPIVLDMKLYNGQADRTTATYDFRVTDYYGKVIAAKQAKVDIPGKQTRIHHLTVPEPERKGFFMVDYSLTDGQGKRSEKRTSFCVLRPPQKRRDGVRNFFGISGGPMDRLPALERMGVQTQAIAFRWAYERENGEFSPGNLRTVDEQVEASLKHGIEPILYLRRTPTWATMKQSSTDIYPPKEEFVHRYEDFAYKVAKRYKGRVHAYQMWGGEADLLADNVANVLGKDRAWFTDLVARLGRLGYKGVKRADPSAIVEVTAVSGVDCTHARFRFLSEVLKKQRGHYDRVVVHPYCYPSHFQGDNYVERPEEHDLVKIYNTISELAGGKPVSNGEWGYSISSQEAYDSAASRRMAAYMVRCFLLSATCPQVQHIMYYTVAANDSYSIWDWPHPRPAVAAYGAMSGIMTGFSNARQLSLGSLVRAYSFALPRGSVAAIWVPQDRSVGYRLAQQENLSIKDILGNDVRPDEDGVIQLSGEPLYVVTGMPQDDLDKVLQAGILLVQPVTMTLRLQDRRTMAIHAVNQLTRELDGTLELVLPVKGGTRKVAMTFRKLRCGLTETLRLPLPDDVDWKAMRQFTVTGQAKTTAGNVAIAQKLELIPSPKLTVSPVIDGKLEEWLSRPAMVLDSTRSLFPPDAFTHGLWNNASDLSVKAWTGWDKTYFYFAARVTDDVFQNPYGADELWAGDCIQMGFDTLNDAMTPGYKQDDVEINAAYSQKEKRTVVSQTWPLGHRFPKSVKAVVRRQGTYIDYEVAIPFVLLNKMTPELGKVFGFNFVATDRDLKRIDYWMGLTYGICGGKDPSVFRKFVLSEPLEVRQERP